MIRVMDLGLVGLERRRRFGEGQDQALRGRGAGAFVLNCRNVAIFWLERFASGQPYCKVEEVPLRDPWRA